MLLHYRYSSRAVGDFETSEFGWGVYIVFKEVNEKVANVVSLYFLRNKEVVCKYIIKLDYIKINL